MSRQPNGDNSIYLGADGRWHTYVDTGPAKPGAKGGRRRHISGQTATAVKDKVDQLKASLRVGHVPEVGKAPTIGSWIEHYLTSIAPRKVRRSTLQGYESKMRHHVIPAIGHLNLKRPLAELVEKIEDLFTDLEKRLAPATALQIFRILSKALKIAAQRGKLPRNPCELVEPPSGGSDEVDPLTVEEIRRILAEARKAAAVARWWVALALGLRQGEVLGLLWDYVDLDSKTPALRVQWELIRLTWRHGCGGEPCGKRRGCDCPHRTGGGLVFEPPKSKKGRRTLPLPKVIVTVLKEHRRLLREARMKAGPAWAKIAGTEDEAWVGPDGEASGFVFPNDRGGPTDPHDDWEQWKRILIGADVRQVTRIHKRGHNIGKTYKTSTVKVHDSRHSAGTTMFANGMERREIMEWMGHSQISVSARYTHVPAELMQARAELYNTALELLQPDGATKPRKRSS